MTAGNRGACQNEDQMHAPASVPSGLSSLWLCLRMGCLDGSNTVDYCFYCLIIYFFSILIYKEQFEAGKLVVEQDF